MTVLVALGDDKKPGSPIEPLGDDKKRVLFPHVPPPLSFPHVFSGNPAF